MENAFAKVSDLAGTFKEYIHVKAEALKVQAIDRSSLLISNLVALLVAAIVFFCFIIFTGVGLAILIGELIGYVWAGYLIVGVVYLVMALFIWIERGRLIRVPVINMMIGQIFGDHEKD